MKNPERDTLEVLAEIRDSLAAIKQHINTLQPRVEKLEVAQRPATLPKPPAPPAKPDKPAKPAKTKLAEVKIEER